MRIAVDLHIHTALSPCAEEDMTPNNIVNMACLKGLDAIAITDHNSALNVSAVMKCGQNAKITVIPGMEVETAEEVHIVCLFQNLDDCYRVQTIVDRERLKVPLNRRIFGNQSVMDEFDNIKYKIPQLLSVATNITIDRLYKIITDNNGLFVPAHIDRPSNGIISVLGSIPENLSLTAVEVSSSFNENNYKGFLSGNDFVKYFSSDAHSLANILERETYLDVDGLSVKSILNSLS